MATDYYALLGVSPQASADEIKRAYRRLARQYHPDANPGDREAEARFKEISVAYETLRDPERRRRYDMFGPEGGTGGGPGPGDFGLNDLFDAFFGGDPFGRGRGPSGPARGPDAEALVELTLDEVVAGVSRAVDVRMPVECDACDGSGCAPGTHAARCGTCDGVGEVREVRRSILGQMVTSAPCPQCRGDGTVVPDPCGSCAGEGRVVADATVTVDIPAGIDDGQRLRLSGRGPAARRGGPPGDLYLAVRVRPDDRFERQGNDLFHRLAVPMTQAVLGAHRHVETFDGPKDLALPPGTQPGRQFRLPGHGVPDLRTGRRGDLVVEVVVEVPRDVTGEQAELIASFAALRGEETAPPREPGFLSRIRSAFQG